MRKIRCVLLYCLAFYESGATLKRHEKAENATGNSSITLTVESDVYYGKTKPARRIAVPDEADRLARENDERLTYEEAFSDIRRRMRG